MQPLIISSSLDATGSIPPCELSLVVDQRGIAAASRKQMAPGGCLENEKHVCRVAIVHAHTHVIVAATSGLSCYKGAEQYLPICTSQSMSGLVGPVFSR